MPTWPGTLPPRLLVSNYQEQPPDIVLRTEMDVGPPKLRRRTTAGIRPVIGRIFCTKAQVATLDTFYVTTCASGSLSFDWTHPRTGAAATYLFRKPPSWKPEHGDGWWVDLQLDMLP